jgi:hypothetical protein
VDTGTAGLISGLLGAIVALSSAYLAYRRDRAGLRADSARDNRSMTLAEMEAGLRFQSEQLVDLRTQVEQLEVEVHQCHEARDEMRRQRDRALILLARGSGFEVPPDDR